MFSLFSSTRLTSAGSSTSLSELDQVAALKETLEGLDLLLNDDLTRAEKVLSSGSTAFHKTGHAAVSFLRALMGFELEMLKEGIYTPEEVRMLTSATERITDAETSAERERKLAVNQGRSQGRYDPGAEYTLCIAQSLLMSAVVSFLSESVVESLRGAYKLRKAYQLLHKLYDMIVAVDGTLSNGTTTNAPPMDKASDDSDDDFVDASDDLKDLASPTQLTESIKIMAQSEGDTKSDQLSLPPSPLMSPSRSPTLDRRASIASVGTFYNIPAPPLESNVTDHAVYSGTLMALGAIMLLISLLPPSLSRLLSIIGFRGSRSQALSMLWRVASDSGPFGALATFVLGSYYGNIVQNSDIVSDDYSATGGGAVLEQLHSVVVDVRQRYPNSALWAVEEARMDSIKGNLDEVLVRLTSFQVKSQMPQIESLVVFESALHYLMTHQYENAAKWFIHMCETNNWSHALYTYIAGICYAELSRTHPTNRTYSEKATTLLDRVPNLLTKRKSFGVSGKRIPFEQFVERKITRFKARAGSKPIRDGVMGPVTEEVTYLLCNGQKRMRVTELEKSWQSLELWERIGCEEEEVYALELMRSVVDRNSGRLEEAKQRIEKKVISERLSKKGSLGSNDWVAGYAYYEMGVISWMQKRPSEEIKSWLKKASDQGDFPLSNRLSIRYLSSRKRLMKNTSSAGNA